MKILQGNFSMTLASSVTGVNKDLFKRFNFTLQTLTWYSINVEAVKSYSSGTENLCKRCILSIMPSGVVNSWM